MDASPNSPNAAVEYCDLVMKGGITSGVVYPWQLPSSLVSIFSRTLVALLRAQSPR